MKVPYLVNSMITSVSEEEPFCLQMKVQDKKDNTSVPVPQHLVTNLEFKVRSYKRKIKFLRARVETCADVNLMPVRICKKLFKDEDCTTLHQVIYSWQPIPTRK